MDSIREVGSGAGTSNTRSVPSSWSGNLSSLAPSSPIATAVPAIPESRIRTMIGLRCPASRVADSIAAFGTLSMKSGIQPGKHSRVSR